MKGDLTINQKSYRLAKEVGDSMSKLIEVWMNNATCIDMAGNICLIGKDFMHARDNNLFPISLTHKVGKKKSGRMLDGVEYNGMPKNH
jgi:hypothetical protein